jgi:outer membrane protein OmpA-like peptidoglycan-associated protein
MPDLLIQELALLLSKRRFGIHIIYLYLVWLIPYIKIQQYPQKHVIIFEMKTILKILLTSILMMLACFYLTAQIDIGGKIRDKAREKAEQHVDEGIDKAFDSVEEGVEDAVTGENEEATEEGEKNADSNDEKPTSKSKSQSAEKLSQSEDAKPTLSTYSKYDFIPGEKVLLFEDFSQDNVGDFPALWNTNATGEVMTTNNYPGKWFKPMGDGVYLLEKYIAFPDNFTIEFDVIPQYKEGAGDCGFQITIYEQPEMNLNDDLYPGNAGFHINFSENNHTFYNYIQGSDDPNQVSGESGAGLLVPEHLNKVKIWVQKQRIRVYKEEKKIFDLPRGVKTGYKYNHFRVSLWGSGGEPLISNIRIAAGLPDMRNKLLTEGKLVTYGIYFDSGAAIVKPESYGTLKEIAAVLQENPGVHVKIIGHTDSDGNDAANLDLSKRRAIAVKSSLSKDFSIDGSRIETDGEGETEPIYSNSTTEGKAGNRRVEIIKL